MRIWLVIFLFFLCSSNKFGQIHAEEDWKDDEASQLQLEFGKNLRKQLIITRGDKGAILINGDDVIENGVEKNLDIKDLTGAGDLFAAGFLHGYLNDYSHIDCLNKGREMSSKIIQQIGARL